jgi:hypothetical protein
MVYLYKCDSGHTWSAVERGLTACALCTSPLRRDYRAEAVGIGGGVRESRRELTPSGYRDLFLPNAQDMATPDDPDGQKGLREWSATHGPREGNKRPMYPAMDKKVF